MGQSVEEISQRQFERDYQRVKPVLERVLPQLNREGWLPKKMHKTFWYDGINPSTLERAICNHYFRTHSEAYEQENPDLLEIHLYWYALLRDFAQRWAEHFTGQIAQRLHEDFGRFLDAE